WVDAGAGDDTVRVQPALAFLPDATDPVTFTTVNGQPVRGNDAQATAYDLGTITGTKLFRGLTIDSARADEPDIDWYHLTPANALGALPLLDRVSGQTVSAADPDWYGLVLPASAGADAAVTLTSLTPGVAVTLAVTDAQGGDLGKSVTIAAGQTTAALSLDG